ncbi:MAG TPA: fibronectin type III domain-containing protein [Methanomassiliicoccales archaeon]|nr:fibronectin type III domain-containing protein [Methanomassiliicoccales archaeon]
MTTVLACALVSLALLWPQIVGDGSAGTGTIDVAPGAPRDLTATTSAEDVNLTWSAPIQPGVQVWGYHVYKSTTTSFTGSPIAVVHGLVFNEGSLVSDTYYYMVKAYNAKGEGASSQVATVFVGWGPTDPFVVNYDVIHYEGTTTNGTGTEPAAMDLDAFNVTAWGFDAIVSGTLGSGTYHYEWGDAVGALRPLGAYVQSANIHTVFGTKEVLEYRAAWTDLSGKGWVDTVYFGKVEPVVYRIERSCDALDTQIILDMKDTSVMWIRLCNTAP